MSDDVLVEERGDVAILTLNRPDSLNALTRSMTEAFEAELRRLSRRRDIRVVVVTGAGDCAFSVGMDLKERRTLDAEDKWAQSEPLRRACELLWALPQPAIAAIRGWCLGGGFEIAINCDLRIAEPTGTFGWPEMQLGAFPGGSAAVVFPRLVGRSFARQMFFTARKVKAEEALARGLVDILAEPHDALARALQLAEEIAANSSPLGCAAAKRMVNTAGDMSIAEAMVLNEALRAPLDATQDYEEGIRAFFERRRPIWRGA